MTHHSFTLKYKLGAAWCSDSDVLYVPLAVMSCQVRPDSGNDSDRNGLNETNIIQLQPKRVGGPFLKKGVGVDKRVSTILPALLPWRVPELDLGGGAQTPVQYQQDSAAYTRLPSVCHCGRDRVAVSLGGSRADRVTSFG